MSVYRPKLNLVVEGQTDLTVVTKLLQSLNVHEIETYVKGGKVELLKGLDGYNRAARFAPWLVVLDLDQEECAPGYLREILRSPSTGMMLRIPVREIEAWLLADREKMARFLGIPVANIPANPDAEGNPKLFLIDLVRRKCRGKQLRQDWLPDPKSGQPVGPGYPRRISEFVQKHWRPEVAAERSDSLARCIRALENLKRQPAQ